MSENHSAEEILIISVDSEIHLATYPFELKFNGERIVGTMEKRGDGTFQFHWNTRIPPALENMDPPILIWAILNAHEQQVRDNLEDEITEKIIRKISR